MKSVCAQGLPEKPYHPIWLIEAGRFVNLITILSIITMYTTGRCVHVLCTQRPVAHHYRNFVPHLLLPAIITQQSFYIVCDNNAILIYHTKTHNVIHVYLGISVIVKLVHF